MAFRYGFRKVKTAESYLDKFIGNYRKLDLNQKMIMVNRIENQHTVEELQILKVQLKSEVKSYENITVDTTFLIPLISFITSLILILGQTAFNISANLTNTAVSIEQLDLKQQLDTKSINNQEFRYKLNEIIQKLGETSKDTLNKFLNDYFSPAGGGFIAILAMLSLLFYNLKKLNREKICKIVFYQELVEHCLNIKTK